MKPPVMQTQMMIRKPPRDIFNALIDPVLTTQFWFTKSSGKLKQGARVRWDWEMYGVGTEVLVKELDQDRRIVIEWDDPPRPVEWQLEAREDGHTIVRITESGYAGSDDEVVAQAINSAEGFTSLLADLKAYLEHGIRLNLVADHDPDSHVTAKKS